MSGLHISPNLRPLDKDNGEAGILAPSSRLFAITTSGVPTASQSRFMRVVPSRNMTIRSISFICTTAAGADDSVDVGIYDATLTKIVSSGATAGKVNPGTGVKNIAITATTLTAGTVYYAAFAYGVAGGSVPNLIYGSFSSAFAAQGFGATAPNVECAYKDAAATLPAGPVTPTGIPSSCVLLWLLEA